jgi:hypothetical protein
MSAFILRFFTRAASRVLALRIRTVASCLVGLGWCVLPLRAEIIDRVLSVVDGVVITESDVVAARELGLVSSADADDPTGAVLARLVDRRLVLAEVDRYAPPEPAADEVDREFQAVRTRLGSGPAYAAALARSGVDEKHLRQTLRDDLRIRAYTEQRFAIPPATENELNQYYREHIEAFTHSGRVVPLEVVRADIARTLSTARRATLIQDWVSGLRRRANIMDLYLTRR